jgi:hypothetical protein
VDAARAFDSLNVSGNVLLQPGSDLRPDFTIIAWGWNTTAYFLCPLTGINGFPTRPSESLVSALTMTRPASAPQKARREIIHGHHGSFWFRHSRRLQLLETLLRPLGHLLRRNGEL